MMIKLGIDISPLSPPLTGVGFYTQKMLEALNRKDISITGFSPKPLENEFCPQIFSHSLPSIFNKMIPKKLWQPIWRQFFLAQQVQRSKVTLFWSPRHVLPWSRIPHIPYILTIHDLVWKICPETMDRRNYYHEKVLVPHSVKNAAAIICISETTKYDLMRFLKVPENKIHVTYLAPVHTPLVKPINSAYIALHHNQPFVLALGTQEPRKNYSRLIEAYAKLSSVLKHEFKLIIVGKKGWGNNNLMALVEKLNLKSSIIIYDYLPEDRVSYLLQEATCLAFPSLYEGFGLPLVEAMAMGTAVITSNIGSMAEIAGDSALLIDPYDVDSIVDGLKAVLQNNTLRQSLEERGLQRAKSFSWQKAGAQFNAVISALV